MSNSQDIPPIITTSHLLLRGIIPSFIGCSIGDNDEKGGKEKVRASAFQMTYRKDLNKISAENGKLLALYLCIGVLRCIVCIPFANLISPHV